MSEQKMCPDCAYYIEPWYQYGIPPRCRRYRHVHSGEFVNTIEARSEMGEELCGPRGLAFEQKPPEPPKPPPPPSLTQRFVGWLRGSAR